MSGPFQVLIDVGKRVIPLIATELGAAAGVGGQEAIISAAQGVTQAAATSEVTAGVEGAVNLANYFSQTAGGVSAKQAGNIVSAWDAAPEIGYGLERSTMANQTSFAQLESEVTGANTNGFSNPVNSSAPEVEETANSIRTEGDVQEARGKGKAEGKQEGIEEATTTQIASANKSFTVTKDSLIENDVEALADSALGIVTKELTRPNTWWGLAWEWFLKPKGAPDDPQQLAIYLKNQLYGENPEGFKNCITQYLWHLQGKGEHPDLNAHNLNTIQNMAFKAIKGSIRVARYIPPGLKKSIARFGMFINPVLGAVAQIPLVGPLFQWLFPPFKEFFIDNLVMHEERVSVMQAIADKYK